MPYVYRVGVGTKTRLVVADRPPRGGEECRCNAPGCGFVATAYLAGQLAHAWEPEITIGGIPYFALCDKHAARLAFTLEERMLALEEEFDRLSADIAGRQGRPES